MEFANETIDTAKLPKFEQVVFRPLERDYLKIILFNLAVAVLIVVVAIFAASQFVSDFDTFQLQLNLTAFILLSIISATSIISFYKRGFAFREHDVLYRSGIISTNIIIIPYNRVQHVALHEGPLPRVFGLSEIRIYTAGGGSSDIAIPGIKKAEAQDIKQLLMGKIQKPLT